MFGCALLKLSGKSQVLCELYLIYIGVVISHDWKLLAFGLLRLLALSDDCGSWFHLLN